MTLDEIKSKLEPFLKEIAKEKYSLLLLDKPPKNIQGELAIRILSKLKTIIANPVLNPIMKYDEAEKYYFNDENSLKHIQEKYILILELQDYIINETGITFIYDKFIITKLLQINQDIYNKFIEDCRNGVNAYNEDVANLFVDIEAMMLNDRNASAENNTRNARAVDTTNRYSNKYGGYGVTSVWKEQEPKGDVIINITPEEAQKKLHAFGITQLETPKDENKK